MGQVGNRVDHNRSLRRLQEGVALYPDAPQCMGPAALCLAEMGKMEEALSLAQRACALAAPYPVEHRFRQGDLAQLLLKAGRPEEAAELLPTAEWPEGSRYQVDDALLRVKTLLALGKIQEACARLERTQATIETFELAYLRPEAERLARLLEPAAEQGPYERPLLHAKAPVRAW